MNNIDTNWYNCFICKYFIVIPSILAHTVLDQKTINGRCIDDIYGLPVYTSFYSVPQNLLNKWINDLNMCGVKMEQIKQIVNYEVVS